MTYYYLFSHHDIYQVLKEDSETLHDMLFLFSFRRPFQSSNPDYVLPAFEERNQSYVIIASNGSSVNIHTGRRLRSRQVAFWNNLLPKLRKTEPDNASTQKALTWVFIALTSALLVIVVILSVCVFYFRRQAAHERQL